MKIESLTIKNIRGLVDFSFDPKEKNVVVSGPNASGKSALVDAIDFLFTGRISRLIGKGTGDLSLQEHGKHVDSDIKNASVAASVSWKGQNFSILRCLSQARTLACNPKPPAEFATALEFAANGYHVLSRRELLRFIAADDSTRAQEIQALLNLETIEELRKLLSSSHRDASRNSAQCEATLSTEEKDIAANLGLAKFSDVAVLAAINKLRIVLGGIPIEAADLAKPQEGLIAPQAAGKPAVNSELLKKDVERLFFAEEVKDIVSKSGGKLSALVAEINIDKELHRDLQQKELVDLGIELLGDATQCPLCGKPWSPDDLRRHLQERSKKATRAAEIQEKAADLARDITSQLCNLDTVLPRLLTASADLGKDKVKANIAAWQKSWAEWKDRLSDPLNKCSAEAQASLWAECTPNTERRECLSALVQAAVDATPKITSEQTAWDTLTRATENWKRLDRTRESQLKADSQSKKAKVLTEAFDRAQKAVLGSLYTDIENDFVDNYHTLHDHEKDSFKAKIRPEGAGVKMRVDFFGRGAFPPHALHSEGHQDSMGLCLFLALMSKLSGNHVGFTVLDDVVMSVDVDHRRAICDLLLKKFPDRQFFITTHDKAWARHLEKTTVVARQNVLSFRGWTVETGPRWKREDLWGQIIESLQNDNIPLAAAALRRELEEMFDEICVCLSAPVPYNGQAKHDLGELTSAAIGSYGKLLRRAKNAAERWKQEEKKRDISEREIDFVNAKRDTNVDEWIINELVHYNSWIQASKGDFERVLIAFTALRDTFKCPKCDNFLYVEPKKKPGSLRCFCGSITWNLNEPEEIL